MKTKMLLLLPTGTQIMPSPDVYLLCKRDAEAALAVCCVCAALHLALPGPLVMGLVAFQPASVLVTVAGNSSRSKG